jgi:transposase
MIGQWCKGQTFGTILVDLEHSQVVDLLPTRSADSLGEWLAQHPEVTLISRDRQGVYAEGARRVRTRSSCRSVLKS